MTDSTSGKGKKPHLGEPIAVGASGVGRRLEAAGRYVSWRGLRVADVGCGNGAYTEAIGAEAAFVVGVDLQRSWLTAYCRRLATSGKAAMVVQAVAERLPLRDASFDLVFCIETLEHVADEHQTLHELKRVVRPGGSIVLTVPNKWFIFETHGLRAGPVTGNRIPFVSWLPKFIHSRIAAARIYRPGEVRKLLVEAGFSNVALDYVMPPLDKLRAKRFKKFAGYTIRLLERTPLRRLGVSIVAVAQRPNP